MEVLVSLLLITSTSLMLLKQQWHIGQLFNQVRIHTEVLSQLENSKERLPTGIMPVIAPSVLYKAKTLKQS